MEATAKILLRRKHQVILDMADPKHEQTKTEKAMVVSILKNVQSLGFTFSKELLEGLFHYDYNELNNFYVDIIPQLKELVGADVRYHPMYPNFPRQVAEASDVELFINAIIHYWSFGNLMPQYEVQERLPLIDDNKMSVLSVVQKDGIWPIFTALVESKTSISAQDKGDVEQIIINCPDFYNYLPDTIPLKENVALIGKLVLEKAPIKRVDSITKYFKTATDVLRLVEALSDGDISLATKTQYRSLKRSERRMIMDLLSNCGNITEDLFRYQYKWIRVAEIIHPFEYDAVPRYKNVIKAFNTLRNEKKPLMFGGKVQSAILMKDMRSAANLLKSRPGEFARQLDKVLRDANDSDKYHIIASFGEVAEGVSVPVLLQVREHFLNRSKDVQDKIRVFFPKGNLARAISIENELPPIDKNTCQAICKICLDAIVEQLKSKDSLGKVYVDKDFKNYLVPFSQRSASKAVKSIVRGSQVPVKSDSQAVRAFIWWTNTKDSGGRYYDDEGRVDIDLSAVIFDDNWNFKERVSYTHLRSAKYRAYHSGDITNGGRSSGQGVAEFIDIDIDSVAKYGRYVVFNVYSFTGQKYSELPNCRFGWMERQDVNSGEIFEPSTVEMKMDLTSESTIAIPVIFDCRERKFIWCDMNLDASKAAYQTGANNVENNLVGVAATCYAMTNVSKPNLYDLVLMNILARGTRVGDRNKADIIFSNDTTVPYEVVIEEDELSRTQRQVIKEKTNVPIVTAYDMDSLLTLL